MKNSQKVPQNLDELFSLNSFCFGDFEKCNKNFNFVMEKILKEKDRKISDRFGRGILHAAVKFGRSADLEVLLRLGLDVNSQDCGGFTPLHRLCTRKFSSDSHGRGFFGSFDEELEDYKKMFHLMISNGADISITNKSNENVTEFSTRAICNKFACRTLLAFVDNGKNFDSKRPSFEGVKTATICPKRKKVVEEKFKELIGLVFIHEMTNSEAALILISLGGSLDTEDRFGRSYLMAAVRFGTFEEVDELVDLGASVFKLDLNGNSCFHYLAKRQDREIETVKKIFDLLIARGLKKNCPNKFHETPRDVTCRWNLKSTKVMEIFQEESN